MLSDLYQPFQPTLTAAGLQRFGLSLEQIPAGGALRGVVHSYLQIKATRPNPYPSIPDGTQAIFMSPHCSRIGGALTRPCDIPIAQPGEYFGIRFYPGALRHFFKLDVSEITDRLVEHEFIPSRLFRELHSQVYDLQGFAERARLCHEWLLQRFTPNSLSRFDQAMSLVYQSLGNIRVSELVSKVGWSSRHLNRLFQVHTGLGTKTFAETIRIQQACRRLFVAPGNSLAVAGDLGFFDQAHLLNDFRKRLSASPGAFLERFMSDFSKR